MHAHLLSRTALKRVQRQVDPAVLEGLQNAWASCTPVKGRKDPATLSLEDSASCTNVADHNR